MDNHGRGGRGGDLAMRIFVELVARHTRISEGSVKMEATASNIATLSLRLSEAFLNAEAEAAAVRNPSKASALTVQDVANWSK